MNKISFLCIVFAIMFSLSKTVIGQERAQDRRVWIDENTTVSDDPRRTPVPTCTKRTRRNAGIDKRKNI